MARTTGPIETKVTWSSLAATVLTGLVFAANHTDLIPGYNDWPAWAKAIVSVVVIAGGTFGAGFAAPHTARPAAADVDRPGGTGNWSTGTGTNVRKVGGYRGGDVAPPD
jgi:hypothetical protein